MSALEFIPTTAGRAALVNAQNTGTLPVLVASIGVTDQAFVATAATAALPGEIKRLTTFAGEAVAGDTIHVTVRDDGADVYTVRGYALYLQDGTLFGSYGQADAIMEKSAQATLLLAADLIFADLNATDITFGDTSWLNPPATTTVQGVTQYATNAEALTGAAGNRSIVASALKYVLDSRFGAGAPSAFVKGLLNLATAALFRAALEIKSAALKDEGSGGNLDADKLDGQHGSFYRAWGNLSGVPANVISWAAFAPADKANSSDAWQRGVSGPTLLSSGFTDLNVASGFHAVYAGTAVDNRSPIGSSNIIGWGLANFTTQLATRNGRMCFRQQENGVWGGWQEVVHSGMLDASDVMLKSVAQTVTGAKTFRGELQSDHITGVGLVVNRSNSATNSSIEYRSTATSLFAGLTLSGAAWAIGTGGDLGTSGNRWFHVDANNAYVGTNVIWNAGNFDPNSKANASHTHAILTFGNYINGTSYNGSTAMTISVNASEAATGGTVAARNSSGDIVARLFRSTYSATSAAIGAIMTQVDVGGADNNYLRPSTPAQVKAALGIATGDVSGLSSALAAKANKSGDTFSGQVNAPTFNATGNIFAGNFMQAASFRQASSRRYKRDISYIDCNDAAGLLSLVRFADYTMRADGSRGMGAIAEELSGGSLDFVVSRNEEGEPDAVNYQPLFVLACAALNGLVRRVAALEARV